jgi:protein O-mannosyl-transferase
MMHTFFRRLGGWQLLLAAMILVTAIYWPGLSGSWLFDDYPNIVDNHGIQPSNATLSSLVRAALSSPSSDFKRPLASLTFAVNYLVSGLGPYGWKLSNLLIHLLNGVLVFLVARALLEIDGAARTASEVAASQGEQASGISARAGVVAAWITMAWMLLPINLTGVLYVVQRMESLANLFVLLGLLGYIVGRRRMLTVAGVVIAGTGRSPSRQHFFYARRSGFILCVTSLLVSVAFGVLAKETAVMLPLYALLVEWALFRFRSPPAGPFDNATGTIAARRLDRRIIGLFVLVLALPMAFGLAWLLPGVLKPETWATRNFTLGTRLLSEARIVVDYVGWTLLPTPDALSFYHDDFRVSSGLLAPPGTLASIVVLAVAIAVMLRLRSRRPLVALGMALFLGCQLLTGTILPLELIYEHRNYFASFGLLLAVVPMLAVPRADVLARLRYLLLTVLLLSWATLTAFTAYAWGNPLRLAEELALRAPASPRAQYELGRTYIICSHYDPASPFTAMAYAPLEQSAALPDSSILPEQALIFMNARMHLTLKDAWWASLIAKLKAGSPGVQDESSLAALTQCARDRDCELPHDRMTKAFNAALSHPHPSGRLFATYGDYAWNVLGNHELGARMIEQAVKATPSEPAYQISLIRMLVAQGRRPEASTALARLETLNIGGRLDESLTELRALTARK